MAAVQALARLQGCPRLDLNRQRIASAQHRGHSSAWECTLKQSKSLVCQSARSCAVACRVSWVRSEPLSHVFSAQSHTTHRAVAPRTGPYTQVVLGKSLRKGLIIRGAVQEPPPSSAPPQKGRFAGRNQNLSEKRRADLEAAGSMAPSPSPLNLIATPGRSALTVNLRPRKLAPEVIWLPCAQEDPVAYNLLGLTANAYLLLSGRQAVAVDATSPFVIPLLRSILRKENRTLSALLLTHRHIAAAGKPQGQGLRDFKKAFPRAPVCLHPSDAEHEEGKLSGVVYENPIGSALLQALGVKTWEFPGHTQGHVHYYLDSSGGVLCTGDTAVGAPMHRSEPGRDAMCRAPVHLNEDDGEAARQWSEFLHRSVRPSIATICPYHGKAYGSEMPGRVEFLLDRLKSPWPTVVP